MKKMISVKRELQGVIISDKVVCNVIEVEEVHII